MHRPLLQSTTLIQTSACKSTTWRQMANLLWTLNSNTLPVSFCLQFILKHLQCTQMKMNFEIKTCKHWCISYPYSFTFLLELVLCAHFYSATVSIFSHLSHVCPSNSMIGVKFFLAAFLIPLSTSVSPCHHLFQHVGSLHVCIMSLKFVHMSVLISHFYYHTMSTRCN